VGGQSFFSAGRCGRSLTQHEQDSCGSPKVIPSLHGKAEQGIQTVCLSQASEGETPASRLGMQIREHFQGCGNFLLQPLGAGNGDPGIGGGDGALEVSQPTERGGQLPQGIGLTGRVLGDRIMPTSFGQQRQSALRATQPDLQHGQVGQSIAFGPVVANLAPGGTGGEKAPPGGLILAEFDQNERDVGDRTRNPASILVPFGAHRGGVEVLQGLVVPAFVPCEETEGIERAGKLAIQSDLPLQPE
jgi:hypothetical protein